MARVNQLMNRPSRTGDERRGCMRGARLTRDFGSVDRRTPFRPEVRCATRATAAHAQRRWRQFDTNTQIYDFSHLAAVFGPRVRSVRPGEWKRWWLAGVLSPVLALAVGVPPAAADGNPPAGTPAIAFDFNGDGYADLAAGSEYRKVNGHEYAGSVHVIYGSPPGLRSSHSQFLTQDSPGIKGRAQDWAFFGQSITSGDFDGDGYADLATRASDDVLIVYGGPRGLTSRDGMVKPRKIGPGHFSLNGPPLAAANFDGDGFSELVVANPGNETEYGGVGVYRGSRTGISNRNTLILHRDTPGVPGERFSDDFFGQHVTVGDVTGDRHPDLMVTSDEESGSGTMFLFRGSPSGVTVAGNTVLSAEAVLGRPYGSFGADSALAVADFDSDGFGDLVVGQPGLCYREPREYGCGAVLIFAGSASGFSPQRRQIWDQDSPGVPGKTEPGDEFGYTVGVGDLNNDGNPDLAIGAPSEDLGPIRDSGAITVMYGSPQGLSAKGAQLWSQASRKVKGTPLREELIGGGPIRILDYGKSRHADLAVHNPADIKVRRGDSIGSINVLYGSRAGVTRIDQLWHSNSLGLAGRTREPGGFGGQCC